MTVSETSHPRYKWRVLWREGVKKRNRFFTTEKAARAFARETKRELVGVAPGDVPLDKAEREAVHEARRHQVPLMDAVHHWRRTAGAAAGKTVSDLIAAREESAKKDSLSGHYRGTLALVFRRARERFGDEPAISITPTELQSFVDEQPGYASKRLTRAILATVFSHAIKKQWIQSSPVAGVTLPKPDHKNRIQIFTPDDAGRWITAVAEHSPKWLAGWAVKMFAGLRDAEANRLDWSEVKLDRGFIEVTAGKSKTITRRLVDIQPNLAAILAPLAGKGPVCPPTPFWPAVMARAAYGGKPAKNAARHSFVSYHVALFGDFAKTEMQAGHDKKMLLQNYRELVTKEEAEAYFGIGE